MKPSAIVNVFAGWLGNLLPKYETKAHLNGRWTGSVLGDFLLRDFQLSMHRKRA